MTLRIRVLFLLAVLFAAASACRRGADTTLATGYVEATDVRVAAKTPGRIATVAVVEGARVEAGAVVATLTTTDVDFAIQRARAERAAAVAQADLLRAGARVEDIQQAEAQAAAALAEQKAVAAELVVARADEQRFEQLLAKKAGSVKQRDDAVARRELVEARLRGAEDRLTAARAAVSRLKAGARVQELAAANARVTAVDAQIAALEHDREEAIIRAPVGGIVGARLVEPGELVAAGTPVAVVLDLDHAWANVYVVEPLIPRVKIDQPATVITDNGDRLDGRVTFISPKAEFTPRNVQTADERAKLVYRIKVSVDNKAGILKPGMPVEVDLGFGKGD